MRERLEMPVSERLVTAEEFERMPEEPGVRMELVRGRVVRMSPAGYEHGDIGTRILLLLAEHVNRESLGEVLMPTGFTIETNPDTVREPDVAFISRERLEETAPGPGFFQGPPDLAVEVRSPGDRRGEIASKVAQYLEGGVRMVWVVDTDAASLTVYTPGSAPVVLRDGDVLDGGDVVPGFRCDVRRIFSRDREL
jgi:Uma2 family endonuclease